MLQMQPGQKLNPVALLADALSVSLGVDSRPITSSVNLSKFRSKKADQRRVINPKQQDGQRTGGAERAPQRGLPEVNPDNVFPARKQERRHHRADPHIAPCEPHIGQKSVDHGKKNRDHHK